jgi:hypothetical protein
VMTFQHEDTARRKFHRDWTKGMRVEHTITS